jgi:hypothetical protein
VDNEAKIWAIIQGTEPPDPVFYENGWADHAAGLAFHECTWPFESIEALCWRIGWNDRALTQG